MKPLLMTVLVWCVTLGSWSGSAQDFLFSNFEAPTRLGSIDRPLAGPGIWGQMLLSRTPEDLGPIGVPMEHYGNGLVGGGTRIHVEGYACLETIYVQMVAWDGRFWGTVLGNVPLDQLGRTDIARHGLGGCLGQPSSAPRFTQPAIVPPIPEPSTALLGLLGAGLLSAGCLVRRWRCP